MIPRKSDSTVSISWGQNKNDSFFDSEYDTSYLYSISLS